MPGRYAYPPEIEDIVLGKVAYRRRVQNYARPLASQRDAGTFVHLDFAPDVAQPQRGVQPSQGSAHHHDARAAGLHPVYSFAEGSSSATPAARSSCRCRYRVARRASPVCGTSSSSFLNSGRAERSSVVTSGQSISTKLPAGSRMYIWTLPSGNSYTSE